MVESAYIHIPFCRQKCRYCSFISFPTLEYTDEYINALKKQILLLYKGDCLKTLYFGGGTPSLLPFEKIEEIIKLFNFEKNAEITLEINPETVNFDYLKNLKKSGINRLSIGVQSFDDNILSNIGRKHNADDVFTVIKNARLNGFDNISLDFIYGLPNQSSESFINDLKQAIELNVEHISLYGLKIEEGCYFAKFPPQNSADEDLQAEMYENAIEILTKYGFSHYEISNFAKEDKYSRHNVNYWECGEYYGFGLAAHGYENGIRYSNQISLKNFIKAPTEKSTENKLTKQEMLEEKIFLGLRLKNGLNIANLNKMFNIDFEKKYKKILNKYIKSGHLSLKNGILQFNKSGILVSNYILADFLD